MRDPRKSSYSGNSGNTGNCIEVAVTDVAVDVRDSTDPDGKVLSVTPSAWDAFTHSLKPGHYATWESRR